MYLKTYDKSYLRSLTNRRPGETKLGEVMQCVDSMDALKDNPAKFVILGIPEDIGVRANFGRGGAHTAWPVALQSILNAQNNEFLNANDVLVLGHVDVADLLEKSFETEISFEILRELTEKVDERVAEVIEYIVLAGKIPIVIGGGHNNSYPIIKGTANGLFKLGKITKPTINAINLDPHADFRPLEGRHSGNGFSYAKSEKFLGKYAIVGLHENYNSSEMLQRLHADKTNFIQSFEDIFIRNTIDFQKAISSACHFVSVEKNEYFGVELDLDSIENFPTSAMSPSGISANDVRTYVSIAAANKKAAYLHLPEAAPSLVTDSYNLVGKMIAYLVTDFIKAYQKN